MVAGMEHQPANAAVAAAGAATGVPEPLSAPVATPGRPEPTFRPSLIGEHFRECVRVERSQTEGGLPEGGPVNRRSLLAAAAALGGLGIVAAPSIARAVAATPVGTAAASPTPTDTDQAVEPVRPTRPPLSWRSQPAVPLK
jgi:hypothetical protein